MTFAALPVSGSLPPADTVAVRAWSRGSSFSTPMMYWSSRRSCCWMLHTRRDRPSDQRAPPQTSAVGGRGAAACCMVAHVFITRALPYTTCEKEARRPAKNRLDTSFETSSAAAPNTGTGSRSRCWACAPDRACPSGCAGRTANRRTTRDPEQRWLPGHLRKRVCGDVVLFHHVLTHEAPALALARRVADPIQSPVCRFRVVAAVFDVVPDAEAVGDELLRCTRRR